jgi:tellurite resistance protein
VATKNDFTSEEWEQLQRGVMGAAMLVAISDPGLFETFKEARTAARHMAQGRQSQSEVVRQLAQERPHGFGIGTRAEELEAETLEALRGAATALRSKAPEEEDAYRQFVLDVARSVAEAAEGVSPGETGALDEIKSALGAGATAGR